MLPLNQRTDGFESAELTVKNWTIGRGRKVLCSSPVPFAGSDNLTSVITRTPVRISLFGGGTDYPAWYRTHGGCVLSTTIDKYAYVIAQYLPAYVDHPTRIVYSRIEYATRPTDIAHP